MPVTSAALRFVSQIERLDDPDKILAELQRVAQSAGLNVMGVWCVPSWARRGDRKAWSVYKHPSMPAAYWPEFWALYEKHGRSFLAERAWRNTGAFTMTEAMRIAKPTGNDRWVQELLGRHGARDVFYCPNGSCMTVYWSSKPLLRLDAPTRAALQLAANAAAVQLRGLTARRGGLEPDPGLSARQRAVLRLVSHGYTLQQTAWHMGIGYKTAQEHADRAAKKLGALSLPHAVAEAIRRYVVFGAVASISCAGIWEVFDINCWD